MYLEEHLEDIFGLVDSTLSDEEFCRHPLIVTLRARGSRGWDDSVL